MTTKLAKHLNPSDCFRIEECSAICLNVLDRTEKGISILVFFGDRFQPCNFLNDSIFDIVGGRDRDNLLQSLGEEEGFEKIAPRYPRSIPYMIGYQKSFCIGFDIQEGEKKPIA